MAVDDDSEEDAQGNRRTGRRQPWTEVTVVSQDRSNPVVELIASSPWPTLARPPTLRVDKSLRDDYRFLLSARSLAYGHGSFMVFLVQLSRNAERTYFSAPTSLGGGYVDCRYNGKVKQHAFPLDGYWPKVLPWRNTKPQLVAMKTYGLLTDSGGESGGEDGRAVERLTSEIARWCDLDAGVLEVGARADLVVIDPAALAFGAGRGQGCGRSGCTARRVLPGCRSVHRAPRIRAC